MFRPVDVEDESVDVAIITQVIEPLLRVRANCESHLFDAYGGALRRKENCPDEIILFCVDSSRSMNKASDFEELNEANERLF